MGSGHNSLTNARSVPLEGLRNPVAQVLLEVSNNLTDPLTHHRNRTQKSINPDRKNDDNLSFENLRYSFPLLLLQQRPDNLPGEKV